ncbi:hypothetical protein COCNU_scaffold009447G000010 [Cocos nucifera]|nr:hypothetical protein [Cocos nucifera]
MPLAASRGWGSPACSTNPGPSSYWGTSSSSIPLGVFNHGVIASWQSRRRRWQQRDRGYPLALSAGRSRCMCGGGPWRQCEG